MIDVRKGKRNQPPASTGQLGSEHNALHHFRQILDDKDSFCDRLEMTADRLPDEVNAQDGLVLAQDIMPLILHAHQFEENTVYPQLLASPETPADLQVIIDRLRFEHLGDEEFAGDLCICLRRFVTNRDSANVEALAWMLRGFFEGLRRHVAFERDHILPLLERKPH